MGLLEHIKDPRHPLWSVVRLSVYMVALNFLLWLNASNFDETELRTIVLMSLAGGSTEGIGQLLNAVKKKEPISTPAHPMWGMLRLIIYMGTLCFILWFNAQHFDKTEGQTIMWMFIVGAGSEGLEHILSRFQVIVTPQNHDK